MRILHVADLHVQHAWFDWVASNCSNFDLIVIAGDLLNAFSRTAREAQVAAVSDWLLKLRTPTVVCSGNHDDLGSGAWSQPEVAAGAQWLRELGGRGNIVAIDGDLVDVAGVAIAVNGWGAVPDLLRRIDALVTHAPPAGCSCADSHGRDFGDPSLSKALRGGFSAKWLLCGHVHQPRRLWCRWPAHDTSATVLVPGLDEQADVPAHWLLDTTLGVAIHSSGEITRNVGFDRLFEEAKLDSIGIDAELRDAEGGVLTTEEFAAELGLKSAETVREYRLSGAIFAWEEDGSNFRFPAWQIYRGRLLPGLKDVLGVLGAKELPPLSVVSFFAYRSEELGGKSPLELLRLKQVDKVVEFARRYGDIGT